MGNLSNPDLWIAAERLRYIEKSGFWRGTVARADLATVYGVSSAQATADLQKYLELNPDSLIYSLNRKRYEAPESMVCVRHEPCLEEAVELFLEPGASAVLRGVRGLAGPAAETSRFAGTVLPLRAASLAVQRAVFRGLVNGLLLRVRYRSLSGKPEAWRDLVPLALGHDGYRWHLRAWSAENGEFRDYVLSRMVEVEWPMVKAVDAPPDVDWLEWMELPLTVNPELSEDQRAAVLHDFGIKDGGLVIRVRKAMQNYLRRHLGLPIEGKLMQPLLVERA
jgi:hypothetical protein